MHRLFAAFCLATAKAATLGPQLAGRLPAGPGPPVLLLVVPGALSSRQNTPLLVWLNGGPGSSSMMGLFLENGPYWIAGDGSLHARNASWNNKFDALTWTSRRAPALVLHKKVRTLATKMTWPKPSPRSWPIFIMLTPTLGQSSYG